MRLTSEQLRQIDEIIRAVAEAQSQRFFKADHNTVERSDIVFLAIGAEIAVALHDAGYSQAQIFNEVDPTNQILEQMLKDGYILGESTQPLHD